jgi:thioredoxin-related protein
VKARDTHRLTRAWPRLAFVLLAVAAGAGYAASDQADEMIRAVDLRDEARVARERNLVLMIEFSSEYCAYCRKLESLFLLPMQRNADYEQKVLIRSVSLDSYETVIDFDGNAIDTREFAARYSVSVTPTLVFVDSEGVEVGDKLVGIWSEDYYGWFIDNRIAQARANF